MICAIISVNGQVVCALFTQICQLNPMKNGVGANRQFHLNKYKMSNKYYGHTDLVRFVICLNGFCCCFSLFYLMLFFVVVVFVGFVLLDGVAYIQ